MVNKFTRKNLQVGGGKGKRALLLIIRKSFYGRHSTVGDLGGLIRCKFAGVSEGGGVGSFLVSHPPRKNTK